MTAPTWVNAGTVAGQTTGSSLTLGLPASRTNGNLLIAVWFWRDLAPSVATLSGTGWNVGEDFEGSSDHFAWAWCIVNGSEASPNMAYTSGTIAFGQVFQFTGNSSSPMGATSHNSSTSTTITCTHINSTADNILAAYFALHQSATATTTPAGYTERSDVTTTGPGAISQGDVTITTTGTSSGDLSATFTTSARWACFILEIKSAATTETGTIAMTMPLFTQSLVGQQWVSGPINMTMPAFTQALAGWVEGIGLIDMTMPLFSMGLTGAVEQAGIDMTMPLFTQEVDGWAEIRGSIGMTMPAFVQAIVANQNPPFIAGRTLDAGGSPLPFCTVKLYDTATDVLLSTQVSNASAQYAFDMTSYIGPNFYIVAYLAGTPDVSGTTVNTLAGE